MADSQFRVRDLIFAYENQKVTPKETVQNGPETEPEPPRQRTKSIGNLFSFAKIFRSKKSEIATVSDIEKELVRLDAHLHYYQDYNKESHVAFQEEIFNVLTSIVIIDSKGDENISQKKKELLAEVQRLVAVLNKKLPYSTKKEAQNAANTEHIQTYSIKTTSQPKVHETVTTRKSETSTVLAVSNITVKTDHHKNDNAEPAKAVVTNENSSTQNTSKYVPYSQGPDTPVVLSDIEPNLIPSVSKLKQRFQNTSRTSETHENTTGVTVASYSGLSRSQSMKVTSRTSSEVRLRRSETNAKWRGNAVQEVHENEVEEEVKDDVQEGAVIKPEEFKEEQKDEKDGQAGEGIAGLVSVFKLKNLFEDKSKETNQGNYMSYAGLLRTHSRSKSIDDLNANVGPRSFDNNKWEENKNDLSGGQDNGEVQITPYDNNIEANNNTEQGYQIVTATNESTGYHEVVLTPATTTAQLIISCPTGLPGDQLQQLHTDSSTLYSSVTHSSTVQETNMVVSSSSSSKSSQNSVIEVVHNPVAYSTLSSNGQTESVTLTNGEEEAADHPPNEISLHKTEEIAEEYFKNADVSENVDEEFNKLVEASDIEVKN